MCAVSNRSRPHQWWPSRIALALLLLPGVLSLPAAESRYLEDFEFVRKTVLEHGAAVHSKKIDWSTACASLRPGFVSCEDDVQHVRNVLRLLAVLRDSHSGLVRSSIAQDQLPSKWDGLYGGGLWFAWEKGRVMLRGLMERHPLRGAVPPGSALVEIAGRPAWLVLEKEKRRITRYQGSSSDHSLFSSMSNRLLPFGNSQRLDLEFMTPALEVVSVTAPRWGPGGKAFYPYTVQIPEGIERRDGATAGFLKTPWSESVGYIRITGSMHEKTAAAFHQEFDRLKGMEVLLLDCRGMGGGSDIPAWEMAGRLFQSPVPNGPGRRLEPTGSWQFPGPVVLLQDEAEVSSAETFTWAVCETGRVVSVGRPTGGWSIIPRVFHCPSGLIDFRLGVRDRPTPLRRIHTEGVGWPPDLLVPYGPVFCAEEDPSRELGMEVLRLLHAGVPHQAVVQCFQGLLAGSISGFLREASRLSRKVPGWDPEPLAKKVAADLKATIGMEAALVLNGSVAVPEARATLGRLQDLAEKATKARLTTEASRLKKLVQSLRTEVRAQEAFLDATDDSFDADDATRKAFLRAYGKTRIGRYAAGVLWKD